MTMQASSDQIIYFAWLFGTSIERVQSVLKVHGYRVSRLDIISKWLEYDQGDKQC